MRKIVVAVQRASPVNLQLSKGSPKFGLDESFEEVVHTLTKMRAENVVVLGLFGMGGIGKTCLAWEIYNHFVSRREFQCHCFQKNVRSTSTLELQQHLENDLLKQDMRNSNNKYEHWFDTFRREKLTVIDDIDTVGQFEALITDILGLAAGSRVLVTSQDRDVLNLAMRPAKEWELYKVKVLKPMDSRKLFNWNAFYSEEAPSEGNFRKLAAEVADACRGRPLKLELIGRLLYDTKDGPDDEAIWKDSLKTLNENRDINETLEISYTRLPSDGDKAMFLDIACLAHDWDAQGRRHGALDLVLLLFWILLHHQGPQPSVAQTTRQIVGAPRRRPPIRNA